MTSNDVKEITMQVPTSEYLSSIPKHQDDAKSRLDSVDFGALFQVRTPTVEQSGKVSSRKLEASMNEYEVDLLQTSAFQ
jgi:hypothetical protein